MQFQTLLRCKVLKVGPAGLCKFQLVAAYHLTVDLPISCCAIARHVDAEPQSGELFNAGAARFRIKVHLVQRSCMHSHKVTWVTCSEGEYAGLIAFFAPAPDGRPRGGVYRVVYGSRLPERCELDCSMGISRNDACLKQEVFPYWETPMP